ncbi:MAG TPA: hypothetical protein VF255_01660 [Solirubrobacterales bacterium]
MTKRTRRGRGGLGVFLAAVVALLAAAPAAFAVQSDQYDAFTACPTDHPLLNDPSAGFAICAAGVGDAQLRIGDRTIQLDRAGVQFAATEAGTEEPDCPSPGSCFGRVPGSTRVEDDPSLVRLGPPGHGKHRNWKGWSRGKGKGLYLKLTVESAGDLSAFSLAPLFEAPVPLFKLPIKVHIEAPWLGRDCYVGSDRHPIFLQPFIGGPPANVEFLADPNGFPVEQIVATGLPLVDQAVEIPAARNCGHRGYRSDLMANAVVNRFLDLPSPAGQNLVTFPASDLSLIGGAFDGNPPDGGAVLQAAFDAAR